MTAKEKIIELRKKYALSCMMSPFGWQFTTVNGIDFFSWVENDDDRILKELENFLKDKPVPRRRLGVRMISKCCKEPTNNLIYENLVYKGICSKCNKETEFISDSKYYF